ncbi:hypothetical protein MFFC18_06240 [Mariniblastus fucicola]|uniref:Uncharacterized protein n=1 Tax=Mariniblastus fucicola TaxID=980251 RepID=A0A5B9PC91_9BACT|nr:hypothetical protein MFFC18_06240 [Mariniblastus fucicola]
MGFRLEAEACRKPLLVGRALILFANTHFFNASAWRQTSNTMNLATVHLLFQDFGIGIAAGRFPKFKVLDT